MFKQSLSLVLSGLLIYPMGTAVASAQSQAEQQVQVARKAKILKRGAGEQARVNVTRRDRTTLTGYISRAGEDSFDVTDAKTGETTTMTYSEVARVKGQGLSRTTKLVIGMGVLMGVMMGGMAAFGDHH